MSESQEELVICPICPHRCRLKEGQLGLCRARRAANGAIVDENYGRVTALALDPIEKKPLARFRPGSFVLSVGSYGCNLRCPFCQNADIAQVGSKDVPWRELSPAMLVAQAIALKGRGNIGVAYTYNEPLVGYEYVLDCAKLVHEAGMVNVLVSNGMVNPEPLEGLLGLIDAANIDLKGFTDEFYAMVGGDLNTVKNTIKAMAKTPTCHLEVTTLLIPGKNDSDQEVEEMASWLASLNPGIPYHISRFFPRHHMADSKPTDVRKVYHAVDRARRHLRYVYPGNC